MFKRPQLLLKLRPVEELVNADTATSSLGGVSWADSLPGGTNVQCSQFDFLETVNELVQIENEVGAVGNEDAIGRVQALLLDGLQLGEERGDVDDGPGTDQVQALGVDQTYMGSVSRSSSKL